MQEIKTEKVFGLKVSVFNLSELKESIKNFIKKKEQKIFFGYSLVLLPKFKSCPEIYTYSDSFDYFVADGKGMYWIYRLAGVPLKSDISLPDLADIVLNLAEENKYSLLLLGAEEDVNNIATRNIALKYPNAIIYKGINGYFKEKEEESVVEKINELNPDILIVGISSPKKEKFVNKFREKINATIIIPCGGVIDLFAEKTSREPLLIKKTGMTWLYRFLQEPKRLFKPVFVNGMSVIFSLLPVLLFNIIFKKNRTFSIPKFYGIK